MDPFIRRSMLMTPGNRMDRLKKSASYAADSLVFDLEDSVPPGEKAQAREMAAAAIDHVSDCGKELCIRINGLDTPYGADDLEALPWRRVDSVMLPKVESAAQVHRIEHALERCGGLQGRHGPLQFIIMLETPRGIFNALQIADASEYTSALFFGSGDYTSSMNAEVHPDVLQFPRSIVCAAAGARKIQAIDAAYFLKVRDADAAREDARLARRFGFSGKVVFHPAQIEPVNQVFTPSAQEIRDARRLVDAYEASRAAGIGTLVSDGTFIAVDLVAPAQRLLDIAQRLNLSQEARN